MFITHRFINHYRLLLNVIVISKDMIPNKNWNAQRYKQITVIRDAEMYIRLEK